MFNDLVRKESLKKINTLEFLFRKLGMGPYGVKAIYRM